MVEINIVVVKLVGPAISFGAKTTRWRRAGDGEHCAQLNMSFRAEKCKKNTEQTKVSACS